MSVSLSETILKLYKCLGSRLAINNPQAVNKSIVRRCVALVSAKNVYASYVLIPPFFGVERVVKCIYENAYFVNVKFWYYLRKNTKKWLIGPCYLMVPLSMMIARTTDDESGFGSFHGTRSDNVSQYGISMNVL